MFKSIFTTVMLMFSLATQAQFTLKGIVYDAQKKEPLTGASVILKESAKATSTDARGYFEFDNLTGDQTVKITFVGYTSKQMKVTVNQDLSLEVFLEQSSIVTDAVVVSATRANEKTPTTYTTVDKEAIQQQNFGQDVPFLLNWTPSVVTTSDAGTGIGYTGIRIRGSDATRINVTINGIPYNDSESLGTFWVDIPDIASSSQSVQIQRGVGTSTNGAGAFGASINLLTNVRNDDAYAEVINAGGSFKTHRHTLSFGSGLLNDHFILEGRVSRIKSDGYIDRGTADLGAYYFSGGYYGKNTFLKAVVFGGKERTYQAWYGVPESKLKNDTEAMLITAMNEGWNEEQTENLLKSDSRTFNPYTYKDQVDDYQQDHFQLHFSHQFNSSLTWNTSLHYTPGKGYYEEYRYDNDLEDYGLENIILSDDDGVTTDNDTITSMDLVRRRWLDNDFYGFTYSLNYSKDKLNAIFGGGWNQYDGKHFGEITWAEISQVSPGYQYYFNKGKKRDFNAYLKTSYQIGASLNAFVDLQIRKIDYTASGSDNKQTDVNIDAKFDFFNPKFGLTYDISNTQQLYGSFAVANREPLREDFLSSDQKPKHETLHNLELGYRLAQEKFLLNVNYYLMNYKNQLVLTGELNDVGAPLRANAGESYRMGIEVEGAVKISEKLQWNANFTVSRNKVRKFTELLEDYGDNFDEYNVVKNEYKDTDISFSPNLIAGSQLSFFPIRALEFAVLTKYVSKQYLDNTQNENRTIAAYLVNDLRIGYTIKPSFAEKITFSVLVNNILNEEYESNGYTWGYLAGSTAYRENYYYPQAGRNFMAMLSMRF